MKKTTPSNISAEYWQTENGNPLAQTLHGDGQEALDMLHSVENALDMAIGKESDPQIKEELRKARRQVLASMNTYRKAVDVLSEYGF